MFQTRQTSSILAAVRSQDSGCQESGGVVTRGSVRGLCGLETDCFSPWDLVSGECLLHEDSASWILFRLFCICFFNTFPKSPLRNGAGRYLQSRFSKQTFQYSDLGVRPGRPPPAPPRGSSEAGGLTQTPGTGCLLAAPRAGPGSAPGLRPSGRLALQVRAPIPVWAPRPAGSGRPGPSGGGARPRVTCAAPAASRLRPPRRTPSGRGESAVRPGPRSTRERAPGEFPLGALNSAGKREKAATEALNPPASCQSPRPGKTRPWAPPGPTPGRARPQCAVAAPGNGERGCVSPPAPFLSAESRWRGPEVPPETSFHLALHRLPNPARKHLPLAGPQGL